MTTWRSAKELGELIHPPQQQALPVEPKTVSMCKNSSYAEGWNDCLASKQARVSVTDEVRNLLVWAETAHACVLLSGDTITAKHLKAACEAIRNSEAVADQLAGGEV